MIDIYNIPLNDKKTWDMICDGDCIGMFQIESNLGKVWCQKIKPRNIEELSAVIALVRPGCLKAMEDDENGNTKNLTQHYADRKNGIDKIIPIHPVVDAILGPTYNILVYQEQAIKISTDCAGFSPTEADSLRKAAGKKIASLMAEVKTKFIEKAKTFGVIDDDLAAKLFSWIEKSNRYSFNKSHSVSYALNSYYSAYVKCHAQKEFYTSWLHYGLQSQEPFSEIARIANDAKLHDCDVLTPDIYKKNKNFKLFDGTIFTGLLDVKGVGEAQITKLRAALDEQSPNIPWVKLLHTVADKVSVTCFDHLIKVGGIRYKDMSRKRMLREYEMWQQLTVKEKTGIMKDYDDADKMSDLFRRGGKVKSEGGFCANKNRAALVQSLAESLDNPPYSLEDNPRWIADQEKELLGISLTCSQVDECDTFEANCSCKEFASGFKSNDNFYILAANITEIRDIKIKNGKNIGKKMAYLSVGDSSGIIGNVTIFANEYEKYSDLLATGNNVLISGIRDKKSPSTFVVKGIQSL